MKFEDALRLVDGVPYMSEEQGRELYNFIMREKPKSCLELGHAHGVSSIYIAAALDEIGNGGHLETVDILGAADRKPNLEELLIHTGLEKYVTIYREKNSYTWFLKKKIEQQSANSVCEPCYDFAFIDGAKNWTIDGIAFFLTDKLLKQDGWVLFDDYSWTYHKKLHVKGKEVTDGITIRSMAEDEQVQPHVEKIFQLLVQQHPSYSNFEVQSRCWAWAQKAAGRREVKHDSKWLKPKAL